LTETCFLLPERHAILSQRIWLNKWQCNRPLGTVNNNIGDDNNNKNNNFKHSTSFLKPENMNPFRKAMTQDKFSLFYLFPLEKLLKIFLNSAKIVPSIYFQS
jgi:hypothetical protein